MEKVMREEKFLKEEPERLESALRRCKKLTGTLVTLKRFSSVCRISLCIYHLSNILSFRLASVQEQRLPCSNSSSDGRLSPTVTETPPITPTSAQHSKVISIIIDRCCRPACMGCRMNQFVGKWVSISAFGGGK